MRPLGCNRTHPSRPIKNRVGDGAGLGSCPRPLERSKRGSNRGMAFHEPLSRPWCDEPGTSCSSHHLLSESLSVISKPYSTARARTSRSYVPGPPVSRRTTNCPCLHVTRRSAAVPGTRRTTNQQEPPVVCT